MTLPRIPRIPRVLRFFFAALLALALPALARETCWLRPIPAPDSWSREECDRFLAASNVGAPLDLTFLVESADPADGHAPVAGAEVRWLCPPPDSRWGWECHDDAGSFAALADSNGIARLQGVATNWPASSASLSSVMPPPLYSSDPRLPGVRFPALRVSREGFYTRLSPMRLGPPDESGTWTAAPADGSGWGVEGECHLRRVRRPHPMRVSSFAAGADFPEGPVGYDAGRGAFLPPLGDGETADFFVESGQTPGAWPCATYRWIVVRPAGPDGALALVPAFPDELRTPLEVPGPSMPGSDLPFLRPGAPLRFLHPFRRGRAGAVFRSGCTAPVLADELWDRCMPSAAAADDGGGFAAHNAIVFRSRVRPAAAGGAAAVRYGAIVPPDIDDEFLCPARFLVRFNETDGERGLEPADLRVPEPAARAAAAPAGERLVEGPWAYRLLDGGRGVALAGFDAIDPWAFRDSLHAEVAESEPHAE